MTSFCFRVGCQGHTDMIPTKILKILALALAATLTNLVIVASADTGNGDRGQQFTIAVIPDTQNYLDYTHQKDEGFPFNANDLFMEQMQYIASNLKSQGGDIAFVTSLGDVWQHGTKVIDEEHEARGFKAISDHFMAASFAPSEKTVTVEMANAHEGFSLIAGKTPFSVVPGNHDYDAIWWDSRFPPTAKSLDEIDPHALTNLGVLHAGGLDNFRAVFGAETEFFKDQPWYVASHDGGADSAQVFVAGGYRFLHIGLQFNPPNTSLEWAAKIIQRYKGLPTIVTTHDYMNAQAERISNPVIDSHRVDPVHNTPEMVWEKFVSQHDQIFLVLCGHQHGQAARVDSNTEGNPVWQILADYQHRAQTAIEAGVEVTKMFKGIGDGWMRLMSFDFSGAEPTLTVKTYSTHYKKFSRETPEYAQWYKDQEEPTLTDSDYQEVDDFVITLSGFTSRFEREG